MELRKSQKSYFYDNGIKNTGLNFTGKAEQLKTQTSVMDSLIKKGYPNVLTLCFRLYLG
jgi:hypothetical protein